MTARPLTARTFSHRLYDLLLLLYPRSFRNRFGLEMSQIFAGLHHDRGLAHAWLRVIKDLPSSFLKAHLQEKVSSSKVIRGVAFAIYVPLGIMFIIGSVLFFTVEAYFPLVPTIDTRVSDGFTMEGFDAIQLGMSAEEVHALIGQPLVMQQGMALDFNGSCRIYSEDGASKYWDFAWVEQRVCFDEYGVVTSKHSEWFYN